jgi:hypothetical protein
MQYPGGSFVYPVANIFEFGASIPVNATVTSYSAQTFLRDLRVPKDKLNNLGEADRSFYLWPDPNKVNPTNNNNAQIISSNPGYSLSPINFDPNAYCQNGSVRTQITEEWQDNLSDVSSQAVGGTIVLSSDIKKMPTSFKINFPSIPQTHCALPLSTSGGKMIIQSEDGLCMFMIVRNATGDLSQTQPYLAIFSKPFSDAIGFSKENLEKTAQEFRCKN